MARRVDINRLSLRAFNSCREQKMGSPLSPGKYTLRVPVCHRGWGKYGLYGIFFRTVGSHFPHPLLGGIRLLGVESLPSYA